MEINETLENHKVARLVKLATEAAFTLTGWCIMIGSIRVAGEEHHSTVLIVFAFFLNLALLARVWLFCFVQINFGTASSVPMLKKIHIKETATAVGIYIPLIFFVIPSLQSAIKAFMAN